MRRRCLYRGCPTFIRSGSYCPDHKPYGPGWPPLSAGILRRDDYQCQIRGPHCTGKATTVDHMDGDPLGNRPSNLQAACRQCNTAKGGL